MCASDNSFRCIPHQLDNCQRECFISVKLIISIACLFACMSNSMCVFVAITDGFKRDDDDGDDDIQAHTYSCDRVAVAYIYRCFCVCVSW